MDCAKHLIYLTHFMIDDIFHAKCDNFQIKQVFKIWDEGEKSQYHIISFQYFLMKYHINICSKIAISHLSKIYLQHPAHIPISPQKPLPHTAEAAPPLTD